MDTPFIQQPPPLIRHGYGRHDCNPNALKNLLYIDSKRNQTLRKPINHRSDMTLPIPDKDSDVHRRFNSVMDDYKDNKRLETEPSQPQGHKMQYNEMP